MLVDGFHDRVGGPSSERLDLLVGISKIVEIGSEEVTESVKTEVGHACPVLCPPESLVQVIRVVLIDVSLCTDTVCQIGRDDHVAVAGGGLRRLDNKMPVLIFHDRMGDVERVSVQVFRSECTDLGSAQAEAAETDRKVVLRPGQSFQRSTDLICRWDVLHRSDPLGELRSREPDPIGHKHGGDIMRIVGHGLWIASGREVIDELLHISGGDLHQGEPGKALRQQSCISLILPKSGHRQDIALGCVILVTGGAKGSAWTVGWGRGDQGSHKPHGLAMGGLMIHGETVAMAVIGLADAVGSAGELFNSHNYLTSIELSGTSTRVKAIFAIA